MLDKVMGKLFLGAFKVMFVWVIIFILIGISMLVYSTVMSIIN